MKTLHVYSRHMYTHGHYPERKDASPASSSIFQRASLCFNSNIKPGLYGFRAEDSLALKPHGNGDSAWISVPFNY
jgi:hypothetical protein